MKLKELKEVINSIDEDVEVFVREEGSKDLYETKRATIYDVVGVEKYVVIVLAKEE